MRGIFSKNTWINTIYKGSSLVDYVYYGNIKVFERKHAVTHMITVNASDNANIRLTTFNTTKRVNDTSSATIEAAEGDLVFYKITKNGYNTIYSWVEVTDDLTINKTVTPLCFKFTTETEPSGSAPDEAYVLKLELLNTNTYQVVKSGYINWNDVKDITELRDYMTDTEIQINTLLAHEDYFEVNTELWGTDDSSAPGIPLYSDVNCTNQIDVYYGYDGTYWERFVPRENGDRYELGWLKEGYSEGIGYTLPLLDDWQKTWQNLNATLYVDWGDETTSEITGELTTANLTHFYDKYGKYQISITSSNNMLPRVEFGASFMDKLRKYLISVDTPLLDIALKEGGIGYLFWQCSNLKSVCEDLFSNLTDITFGYGVFLGCTSLKNLPKGIFNVEGMYYYYQALMNAYNLKHGEFFNPEVLKNLEHSAIFSSCFYGVNNWNLEKGTIQELWKIPFKEEPSISYAYYGEYGNAVTNWEDVPEEWYGPIDLELQVQCPNDNNAVIYINNEQSAAIPGRSGYRFTYVIEPGNLSETTIPYYGIDYASAYVIPSPVEESDSESGFVPPEPGYPYYLTYNRLARSYQLYGFPGNHNLPFVLTKIDNMVFATAQQTSSYSSEGIDQIPVITYSEEKDRWYEAEGIPADETLTYGPYQGTAGVFKLNNKYYTILQTAEVYSSTDGYNWIKEPETTGLSEYGEGQRTIYELVSNNTNIAVIRPWGTGLLYTEDGINYHKCTIDDWTGMNSIYALTYQNNYFWMSYSNNLYRSADGKTFSIVANLEKDFYAITYQNDKYFAQCWNNTKLYYSTDGINWSYTTLSKATMGVRYYNGKYVANSSSGIFTSTDGINWSSLITNKGNIQNFKDSITLDNGRLWIGSYSDIYEYNLTLY